MSIYIKVKGNDAIQYPYNRVALQLDNPSTSYDERYDLLDWFSQTETALIHGYTLEEVVKGDVPVINHSIERNAEDAHPTLIEGVWVILTVTIPLTSDEIEARVTP